VIITNFDKREHIKTCRQLPLPVDISRLQSEVEAIPVEFWDNQRAPVHRHTRSVFLKGYPPLLGKPDDPEQPILQSCPYIRELIYGVLPGAVGKCLLASLQPGCLVYPHTDTANDYFVHSYRVHIPVFTNSLAKVFCNGQFFHMASGEIWLLNNLAPHAVINDHPDMHRVHLIFDIFPEQRAIDMADSLPEAEGDNDPEMFERLVKKARSPGDQNS
jgi:hypothetical protein